MSNILSCGGGVRFTIPLINHLGVKLVLAVFLWHNEILSRFGVNLKQG